MYICDIFRMHLYNDTKCAYQANVVFFFWMNNKYSSEKKLCTKAFHLSSPCVKLYNIKLLLKKVFNVAERVLNN